MFLVLSSIELDYMLTTICQASKMYHKSTIKVARTIHSLMRYSTSSQFSFVQFKYVQIQNGSLAIIYEITNDV